MYIMRYLCSTEAILYIRKIQQKGIFTGISRLCIYKINWYIWYQLTLLLSCRRLAVRAPKVYPLLLVNFVLIWYKKLLTWKVQIYGMVYYLHSLYGSGGCYFLNKSNCLTCSEIYFVIIFGNCFNYLSQ